MQVKSELAEVRRATTRTKQAAVSDGSELKRIDRSIAKYRKQTAELREMLDSGAEQVERLKHVQSIIFDLDAQIENQEAENELMQRVYDRQAEGVAALNPSGSQAEELARLKEAQSRLAAELRGSQQAITELNRQQQRQTVAWSRLCARRERLKRSIADGGSEAPAEVKRRASGTGTSLMGETAEVQQQAQKMRNKTQSQCRRIQVKLNDVTNAIRCVHSATERAQEELREKEKKVARHAAKLGPEAAAAAALAAALRITTDSAPWPRHAQT